MKLLTTMALAGTASVLTAASAMATPVLIQHQFSGENDCSGYFTLGSGFDSCQVWVGGEDKEQIAISPVIAKYDFKNEDADDGDVVVRINKDYASFDDSKMKLSFDDDKGKTGEWEYGADDPGIRYWAAKGSNNFNLFWYIDAADENVSCSSEGVENYNLACLELANVVNEGTWATPENNGGNFAGLSHLTFYNAEQPYAVPEPGTLALLGLGLVGLGVARRKSKAAA